MSNELKLFALAQSKPAPSKEQRTMSSNVPSVLPRKLRLPRDASIQYTDYPPQLYLNMTITKVEHIQALAETLETFTRLLEDD